MWVMIGCPSVASKSEQAHSGRIDAIPCSANKQSGFVIFHRTGSVIPIADKQLTVNWETDFCMSLSY